MRTQTSAGAWISGDGVSACIPMLIYTIKVAGRSDAAAHSGNWHVATAIFTTHDTPNARRNVLLLSGNTIPAHFPSNLMDAVKNVFHEGGYVHWLTPEPSARLLPCLQMRHGFRLELYFKLILLLQPICSMIRCTFLRRKGHGHDPHPNE